MSGDGEYIKKYDLFILGMFKTLKAYIYIYIYKKKP